MFSEFFLRANLHCWLLGVTLVLSETASAQNILNSGAASGAEVPRLRRQLPWFKDPDLLAHVKLSKRQYSQLETDYNRLWRRYDAALRALDADLAEDARRAKEAQIEKEFDDAFTRALDTVITDSKTRKRYEQLYRQYQGYSVFRNSELREQLNLSSQQLEQLMILDKEWQEENAQIRAEFSKDRPAAMRKLKHARHRMEDSIESTLSPEQLVVWNELTGETYEFSPQVYFPSSAPQRQQPLLLIKDVATYKIVIQDNRQVGQVVDFIVSEGNAIDYILASNQNQYFVIPFIGAAVHGADRLVFLDLTPAQFQQMQFFTADNWPDFYEPVFQQAVFSTFGIDSLRPEGQSTIRSDLDATGRPVDDIPSRDRGKNRNPLDDPDGSAATEGPQSSPRSKLPPNALNPDLKTPNVKAPKLRSGTSEPSGGVPRKPVPK